MHRIGLVLASKKRQDVPVTRWLDAISPLPRVTRSLCLGTVSTLLSRCASPRGSFSRAQFALGAAKASSAVLKLTLYTPAFASGHGHPFNWSATKSLQSTPCGSCSGDFAGGNINPSPATHPHPNLNSIELWSCFFSRRHCSYSLRPHRLWSARGGHWRPGVGDCYRRGQARQAVLSQVVFHQLLPRRRERRGGQSWCVGVHGQVEKTLMSLLLKELPFKVGEYDLLTHDFSSVQYSRISPATKATAAVPPWRRSSPA